MYTWEESQVYWISSTQNEARSVSYLLPSKEKWRQNLELNLLVKILAIVDKEKLMAILTLYFLWINLELCKL